MDKFQISYEQPEGLLGFLSRITSGDTGAFNIFCFLVFCLQESLNFDRRLAKSSASDAVHLCGGLAQNYNTMTVKYFYYPCIYVFHINITLP